MAVTRIHTNQMADGIVTNVKIADSTIQGGKLADDLTYGSNITVSGNLTVNGTTTTIDTVNTTIDDPILLLGANQTGSGAVDLGIMGERGDDTNVFIGYDESANEFIAVETSSLDSATEIAVSDYSNMHVGGLTAEDNAAVTGSITGGSITTAGTLNADGATTLGDLTIDATSTIDMGDNKVTNVTDPTDDQDAATKAYVDGEIATGFTVSDSEDTPNTSVVSGGDTLTFIPVANETTVIVGTDSVTIGLPDDVSIAGNLQVDGNIVVNGTTTTVNSTVTAVVDPILQLGRGENNTALTSDDAKDRGISMYYYEGSEKVAFMGFDTTNNEFRYYSEATITDEVVTGTLGAGVFGALTVDSLTDGTISITGGAITGATDITATGTLTAGTFTDGTASLTAGAWTGITTLTTSGEATLASAIVSDLTENRITLAGTDGALEDDANLTWNGTQMLIGTATATADVTLKIAATDSIMVPVGTTAERPSTGVPGMVRYNSTLNQYEGWDVEESEFIALGVPAFTVIASETFDGDDSTVAFTLSDDQTTASCVVSVNGVVQLPTTAYAVSGTTLTFTEAPATSDKIEVRKLTTTTTITGVAPEGGETGIDANETDIQVKGDLDPIADSTYDLGSPTLQWAELHVDDVQADSVTTPSITKSGTNGAGDIGQTDNRFADIYGTASSAEYADLAEKYEADADYEAGTVLAFGGDKEVTECADEHTTKVAGVVSTAPGYRMNDGLEAEHTAMVALTGRVPTKVTGPVAKGDMMVSAGNGMARAEANPTYGAVIGKALENWEGGEGVIEVVIK